MQKQAQTAAPAAPAANATQGALAWQNQQHAAGQAKAAAALQALANAGAYLVRLPGATGKLANLLANVPGAALPVAGLPALVGKTANGWAAFNVGYLGGANASYAACAAQVGNKKAKATPAFAYALPGGALLTANGAPWAAPTPNAPANVQAAYKAAQAAVTAALASSCLPGAATKPGKASKAA